ncbi:MAG: sigma-70 family RNA polymerase sigma factor [Puia sp.]
MPRLSGDARITIENRNLNCTKKHYAFVSGICLRYLRKEPEARETTNDIFLKVFTKISLYNPSKSAFITWLRTLAVNTCLDKMKLSSFHFEFHTLEEERETSQLSIEDSFTAADILGMINQLPPQQSVIFNLFIVEGFSHEEIASLLDISSGNSRWYLSDAKKRLRRIFTQPGYKIK